MKTYIHISKNPAQWSLEITAYIMKQSQISIAERGRFSLVLSGGSTPAPVYTELANQPGIDWQNTYIFWGDERCVPPDHAESNYKSAYQTLISKINIPEENIFRMQGELPPPEAAKKYGQIIDTFFKGSEKNFDLVLLGLGEDGHIASLFPNTPALNVSNTLVTENQHPTSGMSRISLTYPALIAAQNVAFLVKGENKADIAAEITANPTNAPHYPAKTLIKQKSTRWFLDTSAAEKIENTPDLEISRL